MDKEEGDGEVGEELEVWALNAPLPEIVGSRVEQGAFFFYGTEWCVVQAVFGAERGPIVERHFEEDQLDEDHQAGLEEEGVAVVGAKPVEDPVDAVFESACVPLSCMAMRVCTL